MESDGMTAKKETRVRQSKKNRACINQGGDGKGRMGFNGVADSLNQVNRLRLVDGVVRLDCINRHASITATTTTPTVTVIHTTTAVATTTTATTTTTTTTITTSITTSITTDTASIPAGSVAS